MFAMPIKSRTVSRILRHLDDLTRIGINTSVFEEKKILKLKEIDALLIQDINKLHSLNVLNYDKLYPYLQTLRLDLENLHSNEKNISESEKLQIRELISGINALAQEAKSLDKTTIQYRIKQLEKLGINLRTDDYLTKLYITRWDDTQKIIAESEFMYKLHLSNQKEVIKIIFNVGLPTIKKIVNENNYLKLALQIRILYYETRSRHHVIDQGLSIFERIINENNLLEISLQLEKIADNGCFNWTKDTNGRWLTDSFFTKFDIHTMEIVMPLMEKHLPVFVEISKIAQNSTQYAIKDGIPSVIHIITDDNFAKIAIIIAEIAKKLHKYSEKIFMKLGTIRHLIDENTLRDIVKITEKRHSLDVIESMVELERILTKKNFLTIGLQLSELYNIGNDTCSMYIRRSKRIINEKTLPYIISMAKVSKQHTYYLLEGLYYVDGSDITSDKIITDDNFEYVTKILLKILEYVKGAEDYTFDYFEKIRYLIHDCGVEVLEYFILPTVKSQTVASFLCFQEFGKIYDKLGPNQPEFSEDPKKELEVLLYIVTKKSRRAIDILKNLIDEGLKQRIIEGSLSQEKEIIIEFLNTSPAHLLELYVEFKKIYLNQNTDKNVEYQKLFKDTTELRKDIIAGNLTKEYPKSMISGVLFSVFPPELTVDRAIYDKTIQDRGRFEEDNIPSELKRINNLKVKISKGGYVLKEDIDTKSWNNLIEAIDETNKHNVAIDPPKLGIDLLMQYKSGSLREKQKEYLKYIYTYDRMNGNTMPPFNSMHETLMKYKEFIGDRLRNDLIRSLLSKAQEKYPQKFMELTSGKKDFKPLAKTLLNIWKSKTFGKEKKILEILKTNGFHIDNITWPENITDVQINTELVTNSSSIIEKSLVQNVFNQLYGEQYENMQSEMKKFEFKKEGFGLFGKEYKFILSKKPMHSVAMFNMGVCVAVDRKLWYQKDMWQMIIFDEEDIACGGAIYRTIQEDNNTYLVLSIQPSSSILSAVSPIQLYNKIIQFSKMIVKILGYTNLIIPVDFLINSNRGSIQEIITSKNYPKIKLKQTYQFSYDPYNYSYNEFYMA